MVGFYDASKVVDSSITAAENELNKAIESERPDQIGAGITPDPEKKPEGFVASTPEGGNKGTDWQKRYGDLQRYIDKKLKPEHKAEMDKLQLQITELSGKVTKLANSTAPENLPQSVAEIETLKKESPGAYAAILALATSVAEGIVEQRVAKLDSQISEVTKGQEINNANAAELELKRLNPDLNLDEVFSSEQFNNWLAGQAEVFQKTMQSYDIQGAHAVLAMYKVAYPPVKGKGTRKKDTVVNQDVNVPSSPNLPNSNAGYDFTESQLAAMTSSQFTAIQDQFDKAVREGRILYDISDPAGTARRIAAQAA